ncbi:molybdopterin molybdenumtransferase MoeA, partial [Candidatus Pelagibacter sp.]|nr:molybdopterin molybdenumtransferase MoeA [Candidatus Pelagibacter sp.]
MINYNKAKKLLTKSKIKIKDEKIFIKDSLNRVTAKNIYSAVNYPAANNAAFDGFAINFLDTKRLNGKKLMRFKILKTIAAGDNPRIKKIKKYSAIQVMTGAIIPKVFNTIIPIEKIIFYPNKINPKFILIKNKVRKNNYIRFLGSDYKKNEKIISMGEVINSSHILAFKSLGIDRILVKKKPVILFISTGNEISNKNKIPKWKVRNSNSHYINSLSSRSFFKYLDGGILRDKDEDLLKKKINK